MTDDSGSETMPSFLSSLPGQPITDDIVKQIGESNHPKIHGTMGFPGSTPGTIEVFLVNMDGVTHVLVFDSPAERWRVYESFDNTDMNHQQMIDHATEIANDRFAESRADRIGSAEDDGSEV